jgi:ankyrin repeat protein
VPTLAEGHHEVVELLVDAGAAAAARFPPDGATLLHVAAAFDRVQVVAFLLERFDRPAGRGMRSTFGAHVGTIDVVGRCTLNSFDPYPITYSLSNP